jgi:hypothetical protein
MKASIEIHQAKDTQLMMGPIADKIWPFEDNSYCVEILNGILNFDDDIAEITEVEDLDSIVQHPDPSSPIILVNSRITQDGMVSPFSTHTQERTYCALHP